MPGLRAPDFTDVSANRADDGTAFCGRVSGVWYHAGDGEMAVFHLFDSDSYGDGFARAAVARLGELAGVCGRADVFGGRAPEQRVRGVAGGKVSSSAIPGSGGWVAGRNSRSGFWEFFVVGPGGGGWGRSAGCDGRLRSSTSCHWGRFWGLGLW